MTNKEKFIEVMNKSLDAEPAEMILSTWAEERYAEEAADVVTAITSMLEAMGIDENMRQEAQRRVNEKNKERGRF